ncbi:hypothetical protein D3C85_1406600 [compost metagenome]
MRSGRYLSSTPPNIAPSTPVNITNTAVNSGTPPRSLASGMAKGVVIERGTSDRLTELSSANRCARPQELPIDAALPTSMPRVRAGQWRASKARCCQIGTAKATVTGPSTDISQWVLRAYSA